MKASWRIKEFISIFAMTIFLIAGGTVRNAHSEDKSLRWEEIELASKVRDLIEKICQEGKATDIIASLTAMVHDKVVSTDPQLGNQILDKLKNDKVFKDHCLYVADLKRNYKSVRSKHFIIYHKKDNSPAHSVMRRWDGYFEILASVFNNHFVERVPFKIDKPERYGRCFAPWAVRWGIRMDAIGANPHELVHIMLFKYSDVPFFHEPVAFMYEAIKGDPGLAHRKFAKCEKIVADSGYVPARELLHFSQLIGLEKAKWASAYVFVYSLHERYGVEKLLSLMKGTPWSSTVDEFSTNFEKIYGITLQEFENSIIDK